LESIHVLVFISVLITGIFMAIHTSDSIHIPYKRLNFALDGSIDKDFFWRISVSIGAIFTKMYSFIQRYTASKYFMQFLKLFTFPALRQVNMYIPKIVKIGFCINVHNDII
jgi:hypothetical protein